MKNTDKLLLILVCLSVIIVTANYAAEGKTVEKAALLLADGLEADEGFGEEILVAETIAETEPISQTSYIPTEDFITENGMTISIGKIINDGFAEYNETVSLSAGSKVLDFDISMAPESVWNYAKINGIVIVPKQSAKIDPYETSYYPSGNELVIKINSSQLKELYIYTGGMGSPSIIIPKVSISWEYDNDKNTIKIASKNIIKDEIVIFWAGFPEDGGTIFLEDRQKIETLDYKIMNMNEEKLYLKNDVSIMEDKLKMMESDLNKTQMDIEKLSSEKALMENSIRASNTTIAKLENIITANVAIAPSITIFWIMITVILLLLLADVFIFRHKKSDKK